MVKTLKLSEIRLLIIDLKIQKEQLMNRSKYCIEPKEFYDRVKRIGQALEYFEKITDNISITVDFNVGALNSLDFKDYID